ncbi:MULTISPECIES: molybdopterin-containing oxidoreductase family protein [Thermodesulfovibrio]|uniref:molybdopterin-containing oxidoreductase family protein n=1 Tax=Thermodesulfovibrio yellowstonii TaxID=28262 RepID=UPI0003F8134D|nr:MULTISPECIES: molybdopterin-dependent oxidoreductase [Thermodesulfovibrio]MDI6865217.1 molybdopterin-dependent oxidoreductase [Thermodesulfovibrio yellowstonii]
MKKIELSRRNLLKWASTSALLTMFPSTLRRFVSVTGLAEASEKEIKYTISKKIPQVCARACECDCAYYVVIGKDSETGIEKALTLEGWQDDPVSRGKYCIKGLAFVDSMYDPDRLLVALKRTNPKKGINEDPGWIVVSTEEALKEIVQKMKKFNKDEIVFCSPGDPYTNRLCRSIGVRRSDQRTECFGTHYYINSLMLTNPPNKYYSSTYTVTHSVWGFDYSNTKYMIWFGFDSFSKCGKAGILNHIAEGKRKGTKIVIFNPIKTPIADGYADEWYPIKPGTDLAVALAMIKFIIDHKLYNEKFLKEYTDAIALVDEKTRKHVGSSDRNWFAWCKTHQRIEPLSKCDDPALEGGPYKFEFEGKQISAKPVLQILKENLKDCTSEWASKISEVPLEVINRIAEEFAKASPYSCIPNLKRDAAGPNYANSWRLMHAINILHCLGGSFDHEGGVLLISDVKVPWLEDIAPPVKPYPPLPKESPDFRHEFPITENIYQKKDFSAPGHYGILGYGLYKTKKIKCVFFRNPYRGLFALVQPQMVEKALENIELVIDWNMYVDDLSYYWCDYILPAPHQFEEAKLDIRQYYPKYPCYVAGSPVQKAPGDCIGWGKLAVKIGLALAPEYWTIDGSGNPEKVIPTNTGDYALKKQGIANTVQEFINSKGGIWINKRFYKNWSTIKEIGYGRPQGRIRMYIDEFVDVAHEPLPIWSPRWTEPEGEYRFSLVVTRAPWTMHSDPNFINNPILKSLSAKNYIDCVWINPQVAKEMGISEGDWIVLETNPKYMTELPRPVKAQVHISNRVARKDCVLVFHGLGHRSPKLRIAKNFGYRDGDLIPQKDPNIVKKHDPTGMGWVEDVYVKIKKGGK